MREINGELMCSVGDIAKMTNRSTQTINIWYKHSIMLRKSGNKAPIPECIRINGIKYWDLSDAEKIVLFSKNIKRGFFACYNRKYSWGKRGALIQNRIDEKEKKRIQEIRKYQELSLSEKEKLRQENRFKYLKKEARKLANKHKSI